MTQPALVFSSRELPARAGLDEDDPGPDVVAVIGTTVVEDELGLVVVAEGQGRRSVAGVATRLAVDQIRHHVGQNADLVARFARNPSDELRERLQALLSDGLVQASKEVYALGHRRRVPVTVDVDVAIVLADEAIYAHAGRGAVMLDHEGLLHRLTVGEDDAAALPRSLDDELGDPPSVHPVANHPIGGLPAAPAIEAGTIGLAAGDRLLLLGASMARGVSPVQARQALLAPTPGELLEELQAVAVIPLDRPRNCIAVQAGGPRRDPDADQARIATLRAIELFRWCSDDELRGIAGLARPRRWRAGELLVRQGRVNTTLFLLVDGRVGVNKDGQRIAETDRGSVFGEMSMLDSPRASATIEAITDVEVLTLERDGFLLALKGDANMAVKVLWSMLLRVSGNLRSTSQRLAALTAAMDGSSAAHVGDDEETDPDAATVSGHHLADDPDLEMP